jgi:hypothetical protein
VAITGSGFTGATAVRFGATNATAYTVDSSTQITATAPAGSGTVDVSVTTAAGASANTAADNYTYDATAPTVAGLTPNHGPAAGGTSVVITGSGFTGATAVRFGATNATAYTVNSSTQITATAPAGSGIVDVAVTTAAGTSANTAADNYTYDPPGPAVTGLSPTHGPAAGGTSVVITGTGFTGATAVRFGATNATAFGVSSSTQITATAPAGTGTVDVTVTTTAGTSANTAADNYTYDVVPMVAGYAINGGNPSTWSRGVTLGNVCSGSPTDYMASEDSAFSGASWQTYSASPGFTLSSGNGTKTVHFKVRNSAGSESASASDSITLSESSLVTLTVNGPTLAGNISSRGDVDWYQFMVCAAGGHTIETWAGTLADNYMYLYGPNSQTTLVGEDDDSGTGKAARIARSLSPGIYYVKVRAGNSRGTGTYTIRATGVASGPSVTSYAINGGDPSTWSRSVTLGNICSGSPTHYMASEDSAFSGASWQTYGTSPGFTLSSGNGTKTVHFRVRDSAGIESASVSDSITLSETDIVTLTVNGATLTGNISPAGEVDWYQFTVSAAGTYTIETWAGTLADNVMYLYGPGSQTTLIESDDDDGIDNAAKIVRSLSAGTYYVKVGAYGPDGTGTYTIRATGVASGPSVTSFAISGNAPSTSSCSVTLDNACSGSPTHYMASESSAFSGASWQTYGTSPGFTLSSGNGTKTVYFKVKDSAGTESASVSDSITLSEIVTLTVNGATLTGNISPAGDVDWYRFTVSATGTLTIATLAGTLADNYMYLYGPNDQTALIEEDDDHGTGAAARIERRLSPGTYYVKIRAHSSGGTGTYTIKVRR